MVLPPPSEKPQLLKPWPALGVAVALLVAVVSLFIASEGRQEPVWAVLENVVITLMGEYPDKPQTPFGRVLQLLLLVSGTFIFGAISGKISSIFVTRALSQTSTLKIFQNHIIICNWNTKASGIVDQLVEGNKSQPLEIVVVSASAVPDRVDFSDRPYVHFIQDDPTHHDTLERLQASSAKAVILLADDESESPDEKNALIALAVKHLEHIPGQQKDIHVIAELVNLSRRRHLQEAGVDEVVAARDYSAGIIAQSAMFRNMSVVYQQLLTYSDDSNEFYFLEPGRYPSQLWGKTFSELNHWISDYTARHPENPLLLMGVKRGDGTILLNPKPHSFERLEANDALVVMAFSNIEKLD